MKKIAVVVLALALFMMTSAVAPAIAIGPLKALDVGNNPKFRGNVADGVVEMGVAENTILWVSPDGWIFHDAKATTGQGRMNNALIADISFLIALGVDMETYSNRWIFLSGDTSGNTWNHPFDNPDVGEHGMLYWFATFVFGPASGSRLVAEHPDGIFATWHYVK